MDNWKVCVKGTRCGETWEIAVVRKDNAHGQKSYGWFDERKLLVSHNGGPCRWPVVGYVWDANVAVANELCRRLNADESVEGLV